MLLSQKAFLADIFRTSIGLTVSKATVFFVIRMIIIMPHLLYTLLKLEGETYHTNDFEYQDKLLHLQNCLLCPDRQKETNVDRLQPK